MTTQSASDLDLLGAALDGAVITPAGPGWDQARAAWNLCADQHPALIVRPAGVIDVVQAVRFARANGMRVAVQSTGHGARALGPLDGALLIRTERMNDVTVDPAARTARAGAGALWSDVIAAATPHGLSGLHGYSAGVGVAGYVLGGGLGWLARSHGLACDHVRAFEVVTADAELRRVDARHDPDLFWALRGGGGAGVAVTAIELELVALTDVYAGALLWPMARAGEVAHAYREWIREVPDSVTSSLRLIHFPPLPELPDALRGRAMVQLTLAYVGERQNGEALTAGFRVLEPEIDRVGVVPAAALAEIAGDPVDPLPARDHARLLPTLTADAVDRLIALASPDVSILEIRHLGGALRHPARPGAAGAVDAEAQVFASGVPFTPEQEAALDHTFAAIDALGPAADRDALMTFAGHGERALPVTTQQRLHAVTAAHDPEGVFVGRG
jgi:FAD/FMN-containing dehydrogenase